MEHGDDPAYDVSVNWTFFMWWKSLDSANRVVCEKGANLMSFQSTNSVLAMMVGDDGGGQQRLENDVIDITDNTWHTASTRALGVNASFFYADGTEDTNDPDDDGVIYTSGTAPYTVSARDTGTFGSNSELYLLVQWDNDLGVSMMTTLAKGINPWPIDRANMMYCYQFDGIGTTENDYGPNHLAPLTTGSGSASPIPKGATNPNVEMVENFL